MEGVREMQKRSRTAGTMLHPTCAAYVCDSCHNAQRCLQATIGEGWKVKVCRQMAATQCYSYLTPPTPCLSQTTTHQSTSYRPRKLILHHTFTACSRRQGHTSSRVVQTTCAPLPPPPPGLCLKPPPPLLVSYTPTTF